MIKKINGKALAGLNKLYRFDLRENPCANENYDGSSAIASLKKNTPSACRFDEPDISTCHATLRELKV
jgi:hypothetical protein